MKTTTYICTRCHTKQKLGKHLHASWECPKCHKIIVPTYKDKALECSVNKPKRAKSKIFC